MVASSAIFARDALRRYVNPTAVTTSGWAASRRAISRPASRVSARGFSHSTCFPALIMAAAISRWRAFPTTMETMSMVGSAAMERQDVVAEA